VSGPTGPDFLPGGYADCTLTFRANDTIEFCRKFGKDEQVTHVWRIEYKWNSDRTSLILGQDPKNRPSAASLQGYRIEDLGIAVQPAEQGLPLALKYTRHGDAKMQLGEKVYSRLDK